jgi:hypothetical protein
LQVVIDFPEFLTVVLRYEFLRRFEKTRVVFKQFNYFQKLLKVKFEVNDKLLLFLVLLVGLSRIDPNRLACLDDSGIDFVEEVLNGPRVVLVIGHDLRKILM